MTIGPMAGGRDGHKPAMGSARRGAQALQPRRGHPTSFHHDMLNA
ncbi:hypothetical protein [Phenylobacterium sp.]